MIILICGFYFSLSDQCLHKYIWLILYLEINILHLNKLLFRLQENVSNLERCYLFWHALKGHWVFCDGQIYICGFFGIKFFWQDTFISYTHILSQYWGSISTCFFWLCIIIFLLYCWLWLASKLIKRFRELSEVLKLVTNPSQSFQFKLEGRILSTIH